MPDPAAKPIGVLGGTFDPMHHGHLRLALEAFYSLDLHQVRLLPLQHPVHRARPEADAGQRCRMIELAIDGLAMLSLDKRELERDGPSYTIDTLASLRKEFRQRPLCLLLGEDSFSTLNTWKDWQRLLQYAHIIVASRHQQTRPDLQPELRQLLSEARTDQVADLHRQTHGFIHQLRMPLLDISSSAVRHHLQQQQTVSGLLPPSIIDFIHTERLYDQTEPA